MNFNPQNIFSKQPMVYIAVAYICGIFLSKLIGISIIAPILIVILLIWYILVRKNEYSSILLILLIFTLGFTISGYKNNNFIKTLAALEEYSEKQVEFRGTINEIDIYTSGQRFTLTNVKLVSENLICLNNIKYMVYPNDQIIENVIIGDTLVGTGKWQFFESIRNPGEYDFKRYYNNKEIVGKIYSKNNLQVFKSSEWSIPKSINHFRETAHHKLTAFSDDETGALLSALILGNRTGIDQDLRESFANVGVIHVLAVSGLHVGYVLIILLLIVKSLRIKWGWDKIFIIMGLVAFSILSGGRPSVIRASIMASLYIFAPVLNRKPNSWNIVATAAFLILLVNPNSIYDLGFQLSFTAVMSIIYFYNLFNKVLPEQLRVINIQNNIVRFFWALFLVSFSAQLGTIPVIAYYFGRIPLIAIFVNLFIIPLIGGFVALGIAKLLLFWLPPLSFAIDQSVWGIKELIYKTVIVFDRIPFASIATPQFNLINLIQYILIITLFFIILQRKYSKIIIFGALFINAILWSWVFEKKGTDIIFLDLGSNESVMMKNQDDKSALINAGVITQFTDDLNRKLIPAMKYLNVKKLNWLIRSQGNSNHQVSIAKTIVSVPIDTVWDVGLDSNSWIDDHINHLIQLKNIDYNVIHRGDIIRIDDQSYIQFLLPLNDNIENSSLALKFVNGSNSILFIDRLTEEEFEKLISNGNNLKADVLKISYPKSIYFKFNEFVQYVDPQLAIITSARTSKYSPTPQELIEKFNSKVLFTDSAGAVWLFSDGKNQIKVKGWK